MCVSVGTLCVLGGLFVCVLCVYLYVCSCTCIGVLLSPDHSSASSFPPLPLFLSAALKAHVHVALRMLSQGKSVNIGDHIPYIVCKKEGENSAALRAFHKEEVLRSGGELVPDALWYLENQVRGPQRGRKGMRISASFPPLFICLFVWLSVCLLVVSFV